MLPEFSKNEYLNLKSLKQAQICENIASSVSLNKFKYWMCQIQYFFKIITNLVKTNI